MLRSEPARESRVVALVVAAVTALLQSLAVAWQDGLLLVAAPEGLPVIRGECVKIGRWKRVRENRATRTTRETERETDTER